MLEYQECGSSDQPQTSEIVVDVIPPGEEWDVRVYVWRASDSQASDFSQVYRVVGWTVPEQPTGLVLEPGSDQLSGAVG